jgi:hypothetical protein
MADLMNPGGAGPVLNNGVPPVTPPGTEPDPLESGYAEFEFDQPLLTIFLQITMGRQVLRALDEVSKARESRAECECVVAEWYFRDVRVRVLDTNDPRASSVQSQVQKEIDRVLAGLPLTGARGGKGFSVPMDPPDCDVRCPPDILVSKRIWHRTGGVMKVGAPTRFTVELEAIMTIKLVLWKYTQRAPQDPVVTPGGDATGVDGRLPPPVIQRHRPRGLPPPEVHPHGIMTASVLESRVGDGIVDAMAYTRVSRCMSLAEQIHSAMAQAVGTAVRRRAPRGPACNGCLG